MRAALLFLVACGGGQTSSLANDGTEKTDDRHTTMAAIERTGCLGWCPRYKVTVFRDGGVAYEGEEFVKTKGPATGQLTPAQLAELDRLFTSSGFMQMKSEYLHVSATDSPSVVISYRPRGSSLMKTIDHYLGDDNAPHELRVIEDTFDKIVSEPFIGTEAERDQLFGRH